MSIRACEKVERGKPIRIAWVERQPDLSRSGCYDAALHVVIETMSRLA